MSNFNQPNWLNSILMNVIPFDVIMGVTPGTGFPDTPFQKPSPGSDLPTKVSITLPKIIVYFQLGRD